jgi:hypothetical protein
MTILVVVVLWFIERAIWSHTRINPNDITKILCVWQDDILAFPAVVLIVFEPCCGIFVGIVLVVILEVGISWFVVPCHDDQW